MENKELEFLKLLNKTKSNNKIGELIDQRITLLGNGSEEYYKEEWMESLNETHKLRVELEKATTLRQTELKEILDFIRIHQINEFCQCNHNKDCHGITNLDNHGGECNQCKCSLYTWKGFTHFDRLEEKINQMLNSPQIQRNCVQDGEGQSNIAPSTAVGHEGKQGQGTHKPSLTSPEDTNICKHCGHKKNYLFNFAFDSSDFLDGSENKSKGSNVVK